MMRRTGGIWLSVAVLVALSGCGDDLFSGPDGGPDGSDPDASVGGNATFRMVNYSPDLGSVQIHDEGDASLISFADFGETTGEFQRPDGERRFDLRLTSDSSLVTTTAAQAFAGGLEYVLVVYDDAAQLKIKVLEVDRRSVSAGNGGLMIMHASKSVDYATADVEVDNVLVADDLMYGGASSLQNLAPFDYPVEVSSSSQLTTWTAPVAAGEVFVLFLANDFPVRMDALLLDSSTGRGDLPALAGM